MQGGQDIDMQPAAETVGFAMTTSVHVCYGINNMFHQGSNTVCKRLLDLHLLASMCKDPSTIFFGVPLCMQPSPCTVAHQWRWWDMQWQTD